VLRVTADSNVYISALHFGGPPNDFLDLARAGSIHLTISDEIIDEVTRVLRVKFQWSAEAVALFRERVADFTEKVSPARKLNVIKEDPPGQSYSRMRGRGEIGIHRDSRQ
jgi:uncharacterized protein